MKFFRTSGPEGTSGVKNFFQKILILVFEVIVQPTKTQFLTFPSETKIMKIKHSDKGGKQVFAAANMINKQGVPGKILGNEALLMWTPCKNISHIFWSRCLCAYPKKFFLLNVQS